MKPDESLIKRKAFVYLRRSQDREDRQSLSLEKQDTQVRQIIAENNLIPIYLPPEERSAKHPGRPIFNDMMKRVDEGEAHIIVSWALSRISRNAVDAGTVVYALDRGALHNLMTPTRTYRNTPDDKAFLSIELAFAKKNNDDLSVQVKEGFETKRSRGQYPGPAPIGYINKIIRPGERNIAPHPDDGERVVQLFKAASSGQYGLDDLRRLAYEIGLKSRAGKPLSVQTLNDLLHRRTYTGVFKYGGEAWEQGTYEPLISVDLFTQTQVAMGWAKRITKAKTVKPNYPYKGVVVCGNCGFNITAYTKSKELASGLIGDYEFYMCTHKSKVIKCKEPQLSRRLIEAEIQSRMSEYEMTADDSAACIGFIKEFYQERLEQRNQYTKVWQKDYKEATSKIE